MPTYDYACRSCGHEFEQFQSITAEPLKKCPKCGKRALERLIGTGGGVIFKGSGFYETDYRSESYKKAAEAEQKSQSKPAETKTGESKTTETKTETKPAAESSSGSDAATKKSGGTEPAGKAKGRKKAS